MFEREGSGGDELNGSKKKNIFVSAQNHVFFSDFPQMFVCFQVKSEGELVTIRKISRDVALFSSSINLQITLLINLGILSIK